MKQYFTPRNLWFAVAAAACLGFLAAELNRRQIDAARMDEVYAGLQLLRVLAYVLATLVCVRISADYPRLSGMRLAWRLIAASSGLAMVRHGFEALCLISGWTQTRLSTVVSLRQIPIVLSLLLLTAGLAAMWSSFMTVGLGMLFRKTDYLLAGAILLLVPWIFSVRQGMNDARSAYAIIRYLQSASPLLLAAPALVGLALHRISQEMGGGRLAVSLRCMVGFLVVRLAALILYLSPALSGYWGVIALQRAFDLSVPWMFALAVGVRWRLTLSAQEWSDRYDANPEEEITLLAISGREAGSRLDASGVNF